MSISSTASTSAPLPFNYLDKNTQAAPALAADSDSSDANDNSDASTAQPAPPPPLPPGQGTRVDQLV
jgi:hypothetical protein